LGASNDDDGIVDAGETIDLAIVVRNHWGKADPVTATLEARAEGAVYTDPYVTMITGTVDYGAIGSFNIDDNGLIYQDDMVTGVAHPFRFTVPLTTPNDHLIPFRLTMTARNGLDPADTDLYTFVDTFYLIVQRGVELPRIIDSDMTLTKDYYYLVPDATLIKAGATVTVSEGTQIQFWSADPNDPYSQDAIPYLQIEGELRVKGTITEPVQLFAGALYPGYAVEISVFWNGHVDLSYAQVMNPIIGATWSNGQILDRIDHSYFAQDLFNCVTIRREFGDSCEGPQIRANTISNSIFYKLGNIGSEFPVLDHTTTNLFDSNKMRLETPQAHDNVFLKNYKLYESQWGDRVYWTSTALSPGYYLYEPAFLNVLFPVQYNGRTYAALYNFFADGNTFLNLAEDYAQQFGGHLVAINDDAENTFLNSYQQTYFNESLFQSTYPDMDCGDYDCWDLFKYGRQGIFIGLTDRAREGQFEWFSGELVSYTNWNTGEPDNGINPWDNDDFVVKHDDGTWEDHPNADSYPVMIELPGVVTQGELDALRPDYLSQGTYSSFENNAILNTWWDPDVDHWMHFLVNAERDNYRIIRNNFWHTTNTFLIDVAIEDYYDDFNDGVYIYEPILTIPPTTTYPFVTDVVLSTASDPDAIVVGAEPVTFTVTFNRDMDTSLQPFVSFGPDVPETDYTVHPVDGGWVDFRTWRGTFSITPITGDGYQFLLISDAVAASDPWLVTGQDSERFRFEIITSGTEAMNLQATGGEGFVDLGWTQNDYDLLAGFNLYRSTTQGGTYSRINAHILSPSLRSYRDTNVQPGQPYYYKFTVVKSDMTESDYSNTADGIPVDTIPPVITHTPITEASPGLPLTIYADVTDNVRIQNVTLYYRAMSSRAAYQSKSMVKTTGNRYSATLSGSLIASPGIEYYIEAYDGISIVRSGRSDYPHQVTVEDAPVVTSVTPNHGPSGGGTLVTISGSNFKIGASVTFGGDSASNVVFVNSNQITCTTPSHFPAVVDVVVTNTDAQSGALLQAFSFQSETVSLSFPDASGPRHALVQIPVNAANVSGLAAASLTALFDPAVLDAQNASVGSLTPGWSLAVNTSTPGQVRISMASTGSPASGDGTLATISFDIVGGSGMTTTLDISDVLLNEGAIRYELNDGTFTVSQVYNVSGSMSFWNGSAGIPGVHLELEGDKVFTGQTGSTGIYTITGAAAGDYTLSPTKSDDVNSISSYDASLALQHDAGIITLSGNQAAAADVTKLEGVTSMDAFYILQKVVDLIELPFPGAGVVWDFDPEYRSINDLDADLGGQDFTGILLGDVSGNWSPPSNRQSSIDASTTVTLTIEGGQLDASGMATPTILLQTSSADIKGIDFTLFYSSTKVIATEVLTGPLANGWMLASNLNTPGQIIIGLASAYPITKTGLLLEIPFQIYDPPHGNSPITWQGIQVNEGAIEATAIDGLVVASSIEWHGIYLPLVLRFGGQ
ncbi:MAG: IPT/TIG domain-containing protein, partial [Anaerolineales bacterium]|nr:IPT/TIG domain-containing protein [Anaerolineales bacterium]